MLLIYFFEVSFVGFFHKLEGLRLHVDRLSGESSSYSDGIPVLDTFFNPTWLKNTRTDAGLFPDYYNNMLWVELWLAYNNYEPIRDRQTGGRGSIGFIHQ
jgi:hypothetical protein